MESATVVIVYFMAQVVGLCALLGLAVHAQAARDTGHAARMAVHYAAYAKKHGEATRKARAGIAKEKRAIRAIQYSRPTWRNLLHRYLGETPAVVARKRRLRELQLALAKDEAKLDHYHVMIRGELRRLQPLYPDLVDELSKLLS